MREGTKMCCAIDLSEPSGDALRVAAWFAGRLRSDLTLLHVNEAPLTFSGSDLGDLGLSAADVLEMTTKDVEPKLATLRREVECELDRAVRGQIVPGRAADEIVRFVLRESIDLLVVGTHGRRGLRRFLRGSVAEEVVRRATCPVIVVRGEMSLSWIRFPRGSHSNGGDSNDHS